MNSIKINGKLIEVPDGMPVSIVDGNVMVGGSIKMSQLSGDVKLEIIGNPLNISSDRSVVVNGDIVGSIDAGQSVTCDNVGGSIDAGGSVTCHNIEGDVEAGGSVSVKGDVKGDIDAGGSVSVRRS